MVNPLNVKRLGDVAADMPLRDETLNRRMASVYRERPLSGVSLEAFKYALVCAARAERAALFVTMKKMAGGGRVRRASAEELQRVLDTVANSKPLTDERLKRLWLECALYVIQARDYGAGLFYELYEAHMRAALEQLLSWPLAPWERQLVFERIGLAQATMDESNASAPGECEVCGDALSEYELAHSLAMTGAAYCCAHLREQVL